MKSFLLILLAAGTAISSSALGEDPTVIAPDIDRAFAAELRADAQARTSELQGGATGGHDGHFFLASEDKSFKLQIAGQIQLRYLVNVRDNVPNDDDLTVGFQTRRTKIAFSGKIHDNFYYKVNGAFSRSSGLFALEDAYAGYKIDDNWKIRWGQFKEGFLREELISSSKQLLIDRSMVNEVFNQDRSQGVEVDYRNDQFHLTCSISDGFNSDNTAFNASKADISLTARGEVLFVGDWKQFKDFTSKRGSDRAVMLGAAAHYEKAPDIGGSTEAEMVSYTVDLSYEDNGWNAYAAFIGRNITDAGNVSGVDVDTYGVVVQGGVYLTEHWELFARFDDFFNDNSVGDDFATVSFGVNNYIYGHAAKFSLDAQWYLDDISGAGGAIGANTGIGYLGNGTEDGEFVVRAQFQLLF
jgi:phosphate-selective porin OprO and OprP